MALTQESTQQWNGGTFHSTKNMVIPRGKWNIFQNVGTTSRRCPKIPEFYSGKFLSHSLPNPKLPEFLVEWKAPLESQMNEPAAVEHFRECWRRDWWLVGSHHWGSLRGGPWVQNNNCKMEDEKPREESESTLLLLADELIDMVLSYSFIDHKDLCRCSQVCRRLYIIATGNELWKKKAMLR